MNVLNRHHQSLQQILPKVQRLYPDAVIRKASTGPELLQVAYDNFHFEVTNTKKDFQIECNPPIAWLVVAFAATAITFSFLYSILFDRAIIGFSGVVPGVLAFFAVKAIFKLRNRTKIEEFKNSFREIVNSEREK